MPVTWEAGGVVEPVRSASADNTLWVHIEGPEEHSGAGKSVLTFCLCSGGTLSLAFSKATTGTPSVKYV